MNNYIYHKDGLFFNTIYHKIKKNEDYIIDLIINHGFEFYKLNGIEKNKPQWYDNVLKEKIKRLVIKNVDYISFESTGFKILVDILKNRKIILPDSVKILPKKLDIVIIADTQWHYFYKTIDNLPKLKIMELNNEL